MSITYYSFAKKFFAAATSAIYTRASLIEHFTHNWTMQISVTTRALNSHFTRAMKHEYATASRTLDCVG